MLSFKVLVGLYWLTKVLFLISVDVRNFCLWLFCFV